MNKSTASSFLCLLSFSSALVAAPAPTLATSMIPNNGIFLGVGGGYDSIRDEQNINLNGNSNVYFDTLLLAFGQASGPAVSFNQTQTTFTPTLQGGFFQHFSGSDILWGFKLAYQYANLTFTNDHLAVPQVGQLTSTEDAPTDLFTSHDAIASTQTTVTHIFSFIPFIGRSFGNSYIYIGAGPALLKASSTINDVMSYIDINGIHFESIGSAANFSTSEWLLAGVGQIGMTYFFSPNWFLDFNYTYEITKTNNTSYQANFITSAATELNNVGSFHINENQRIIAQAVTITINERFG